MAKSQARIRRLEVLAALRKLYRNLLRAEGLLAQPEPIYQCQTVEGTEEDQQTADEEALEAAVELVAEMELTAEQLRSGLRSLSSGFKQVYENMDADAAEQLVTQRVQDSVGVLLARLDREMQTLPFSSKAAAEAALDTRNARYRSPGSRDKEESSDEDEDTESDARLVKRLGRAEKVVGQFVARRLQPAVQRVRATPVQRWFTGVRSGVGYVGGLWGRLNGTAGPGSERYLPEGLPLPMSTRQERQAAVRELTVQLDQLEKQLQESSKARESRLRKAGIPGRARMAGELRDMDDRVAGLSRALAVRTLQLQMEYIYGCIEDEALDIAQSKNTGVLLIRQGSSDEVALLAAEFGLLDQQLAVLVSAVEAAEPLLIAEEDLILVASEIPDLRGRLGIAEREVFGGQGMSWLKIRLQIRETAHKVREATQFFSRGLRLMGSDLGNCGRLFVKAGSGQTLKPREVQALRRTARDLLTFVPFAIILIAPLTPVGHVLIFSFIQKYFPGFFPSQFTARRQTLMTRYEDLKKQLLRVSELAQQEDDEKELAQATAAVARLTAPAPSSPWPRKKSDRAEVAGAQGSASLQGAGSSESAAEGEGPANRALRDLQKQVEQAEAETLAGALETVDEGPEGSHQPAYRSR